MGSENEIQRIEAMLQVISSEVGANRIALFAPQGIGLSLVTQIRLEQTGINHTLAAWARHRSLLTDGRVVRYGVITIWPLFREGNLVALIYLDVTPSDFPNGTVRQAASRVAEWLSKLTIPSAVASYMAAGLMHTEAAVEAEADQLAMVLRITNGNVADAARYLGLSRETIYARAGRCGLDVDTFRPRRRRRRKD